MAKYITCHRRGTLEQWEDQSTLKPLKGEIVIELDDKNEPPLHKLKIGDGVHTYAELAYLQAGDEIVTQVLAEVEKVEQEVEKAKLRIVMVHLGIEWKQDAEDVNKYSQVLELEGITERSRLDLQPGAGVLEEFKQLGLSLVTENKNKTITVYSLGNKPLKAYDIQATIVETECPTEEVEAIVGIPIGSGAAQPDWNQTNETQPDCIKNRPSIQNGDAPYSVVSGANTRAGSKAFTITGIDADNNAYILDSTEGLAVDDVYSVHLAYNIDNETVSDQAENYGKIVNIGPRTILNFIYSPSKLGGTPGDVVCCTKGTGVVDLSGAEFSGTGTYRIIDGQPELGEPITLEITGTYTTPYDGWVEVYDYEEIITLKYDAEIISSLSNGLEYSNNGYITKTIGTDKHVTVDNFFNVPSGATFASNFDADTDEVDWETNTFRIIAKPDVGTRTIGAMAAAFGYETQALSKGATAFGLNTVAHGNWSIAEGRDTQAAYAAHAKGFGSIALGSQSSAEGHITKALADNAHSEGDETEASGKSSHTEGYKTKATKEAAHAEGVETEATGRGAHAQGYKTHATGAQSSAEGNNTIASGESSHAQGQNTQAKGAKSHAEGEHTIAEGQRSHAQGKKTHAKGDNALATGESTQAKAGNSATFGKGTSTNKYCSLVAGKFNVELPSNSNSLFVVGGGDNEDTKKNAFAVEQSGDVRAHGDIYVDCNDDSTGGLKLGTIAQENPYTGSLISLSIRVVDELPTNPASDIIYFVKE